jgi:hypothetical protein
MNFDIFFDLIYEIICFWLNWVRRSQKETAVKLSQKELSLHMPSSFLWAYYVISDDDII